MHGGGFVRYIELGDEGFASRQVDEYEDRYLARYDRDPWEDQFGTLADFRYGNTWVKHWGGPNLIEREEFEQKWNQAAASPPFKMRQPSPSGQPPWISPFESEQWGGQG